MSDQEATSQGEPAESLELHNAVWRLKDEVRRAEYRMGSAMVRSADLTAVIRALEEAEEVLKTCGQPGALDYFRNSRDEAERRSFAARAELRTQIAMLGDANVELKRLRKIEHAAWHMLDDSTHLEDGTINVEKDDFDALDELLTEDHPAVKGEQP